MTEQSTPVTIPGPVMRMFLMGFQPGEAFDGPGGERCLPLQFYSGETTVEIVVPVANVEDVCNELQRAGIRAKLTEGATGIVMPDGS